MALIPSLDALYLRPDFLELAADNGELLDNIRSANPQWTAAFDLLPQAKTYPQSPLWSKARLVLGDGFFQLFAINPSQSDVIRTLHLMDDTVTDLSK